MGEQRMIDNHQLFKKSFFDSGAVRVLREADLKRLQKIELDMVKDFDVVAQKYGLNYSLGGGSVLGAIRHHGFIPWDDDIDINMPRNDFNILVGIFEQELGGKYELCTPEHTKHHGMSNVQVKKKGTVYQSFNELSKTNVGIYFDIFVSENVFDNKVLRTVHGFFSLAFGYLLTCRKTWHDKPYLQKYIGKSKVLKDAFGKKANIGSLFAWIPLDVITRWTVRIYSFCKNDTTQNITFPSGRKHFFGEIGLRSEMQEVIYVPFEDTELPVPKGYDVYLRRLYGDNYMELPPVGKREQHPLMKVDFGEE